MNLYLLPYVGDGTAENEYRPAGIDGLTFSSIDLRPPGQGGGYAFVSTPSPLPSVPSDGLALGTNPDATLSAGVRRNIERRLGVTLGSASVRGIIFENLTTHAREDGTRVRPLRRSRDGKYRIHLGGFLDERD